MWAKFQILSGNFAGLRTFKQVSKVKWNFNKRIVNDLRVTDHHGLLITDKISSIKG
jgi:DNA topoisomerase-3